MLKFIRCGPATVCFALSVGCLALWWRSETISDHAFCPPIGGYYVDATSYQGVATLQLNESMQRRIVPEGLGFFWESMPCEGFELWDGRLFFVLLHRGARFPLWYAALVFALAGIAGIAVLRIGRRFTLRSTLIATTVVAGLLGMAVVL